MMVKKEYQIFGFDAVVVAIYEVLRSPRLIESVNMLNSAQESTEREKDNMRR